MGPGQGPVLKAGGLGQRHGSEAPCCVTLGKACPSVNFSFLPGEMRYWGLVFFQREEIFISFSNSLSVVVFNL